ncbi:hypothetical protein HDA32_000597 [Spinactinospora alkalitolerans]|uniref:Uncharacterized protein n=1 Tax=Spinactinospora alkalitolerans TaxID=687207 RepID=A0A852TQB7_9ACTN|nr:hypothetical protein [Spinactinospora alkalitolerans]
MFRLIDEEKTRHSVSLMSRLLGVSRQGYYKHHHRTQDGPTAKERSDTDLAGASRPTTNAPAAPTGLPASRPTWPSSTGCGWDAAGSAG